MKYFFFSITLFLLLAFSSNNKVHQYVLAENGLILRDQANKNSNRIGKIPYGEKVAVLSEAEGEILTVKVLDNYSLKGRWKKVAYKELTGYVFEKFLSKFPPNPDKSEKINDDEEKYFKASFGPPSEKYNLLKFGPNDCFEGDSGCICGYEISYPNGIQYLTESCNEIGVDVEIIIPNTDLDEGFILGRELYYQAGQDTIIYNEQLDQIQIGIIGGGAGCETSIERFGRNGIRVEYYCGC